MSCWVVPTIAAELWGCSVDQVMSKIRSGELPTRDEAGWTFVDVAPDSPTIESPKCMRPSTYTDVLSAAEVEALESPMKIAASSESDEREMGDWREARQNASTTRRAPVAKAA